MNKSLTLLFALAALAVTARADDPDHDNKFHLQAGIAYASGFDKLGDAIEANNPFIDIGTVIPVGIQIGGYYEIKYGIAVGASVGPVIVGYGDADFYVVPLQASVRYYILPTKDISPFVRAGVAYSIAGGDFISGGSPGFVVGGGLEFMRTKKFGFGAEVVYNSSEVDVDATFGHPEREIKTHEVTALVYFRY
ncbi:MAG TPA: outer membrane beta-barrel protein [Verrucomicrobiae bacterium]|nr:outer membrane beta-barrel protein [Verrucomicrobiae bacterium]